MKKRALYIGRFQPVHNGHLDAIQQIFEHPNKYDEVLIGIGSAEKAFLPKDPLTAGERFELILLALEELKIPREKVWIFSIKNIDRYSLWPHYVRQLCPTIQAIFSGSPLVRMLWKEAFSHDNTLKVIPIKKRIKVSASEVRKRVHEGKSIEKIIPKLVHAKLKEWDFRKRLRSMRSK